MIVKCEQCQTRFKIPDDKVTDKGVKVRCTKCSHTFRVTRDMAQPATAVPALGAPPAPAAGDPFARFGSVNDPPGAEVTRPGVFALGVEATRSPELGTKRALPFPAASPPYPAAPAAPFDFGSLSPPGAAAVTVPSVPAYIASSQPAPVAASPFDFAAIAPPTGAAAQPSAFDFSNFGAPTQPMAPLPQSRPPAASPPAMQGSAFDFAPPRPPAAVAPVPTPLPAFDFGQPPSAQSSAPVDDGRFAPMSSQAVGAADGFFAGSESAPHSVSSVDGAAARAMFDMPVAPEAPPSTLPDIPVPEAEAPPRNIERVSLARPASVPAPVQLPPEEPVRRRSIFGIVVNVAIAAVLVVGLVVVGSAFLNEGKVTSDSLSLENLKNTFAPSVEFVASDVSNGLYETKGGRSVFFVRGEVTNHSQATVKVVVKAEIVEDGKVVRFGESWAGDPATPEEIFLLDSAEALEALNRKVEKRALVVPPDSAAAFVVPFTEFPPELKGFRVRVSARAVPVNPTAANP